MKTTMKKLLALLLAALFILSLAACGEKPATDAPAAETTAETPSEASKDVPVIGISQYGEHPSLDNCRTGFLEGLTEAGLVEGKDYTVNYQNAGFDDNIAMQIGQNFSANNVALMCAIATPAATACYAAAEDKGIPVIFTAITDPAAAGLTAGGATGTSDKLPVEAQLELIRALQPDAKKIGILYTVSEPNSVSAIAEYKEKAPAFGFEIVDVGVTAQAEVTQATDRILTQEVDCLSNLTDNNVVGVLASVLEKTDAAAVPVYGSEVEQVKIGCVAAAGIDYVALGRQTGGMAAKILKGEAKVDDIPFETISEYGIYVNSEMLARLNLTVPEALAKRAVEAE